MSGAWPIILRAGDVPTADIERALGKRVPEIDVRADERLQELVRGPWRILQKTTGFRYSIDALLLAGTVDAGEVDKVIDIGTGSGVIPIFLAARGARDVTGVENLPELADMARRSVALNALTDRARIVQGDIRRVADLFPAASFDVVVSNPPYFRVGTGHASPDETRAASRYEITLSLAELVGAAAYLAREGGRVFLIHIASREQELLNELGAANFSPTHLCRVEPKRGDDPRFVLVRAVKGGDAACETLPPLVLHEESGEYTNAVNALIATQRQ
ncbi:MAG: methyltransferase domain-containing protein [Deltaproteobacteria bacterium]|nr:methyltransferase domain-containing protein [Deltaproteobacteria bacterium]